MGSLCPKGPQLRPSWVSCSLSSSPLSHRSVSELHLQPATPENKENAPPPPILIRLQGQIWPLTDCQGRLQAEFRPEKH